MKRTSSTSILVALVVALCVALVGAGKTKGNEKAKPKGKPVSEAVWVVNAVDNTGRHAIVARSSGKVYKVKKASGCAAIKAYDSQKLLLVSPGSFLAAGSHIDIPQEDAKCEIGEGAELKKGELHAVSTELDERKAALVKRVQEALALMGKYSGEVDGKLDKNTAGVFKTVQKGLGIKPTGDVSAEFLLALMAHAAKKDNLELLTHLSKILWPYAAAI